MKIYLNCYVSDKFQVRHKGFNDGPTIQPAISTYYSTHIDQWTTEQIHWRYRSAFRKDILILLYDQAKFSQLEEYFNFCLLKLAVQSAKTDPTGARHFIALLTFKLLLQNLELSTIINAIKET
jgi:hypothetical protein